MLHHHHRRHAVRDRIVDLEVKKLELRKARARAVQGQARPQTQRVGRSLHA